MATKPKAVPVVRDEAAPEATQLLKAVEPIRCDGVDYAPGDVLEVSMATGESLIAAGAATPELQG